MQILDLCDKIFFPVMEEKCRVEYIKINEFKSLIGRNGYADILSKLVYINVPEDDDINTDLFNFERLKRHEYFKQLSTVAQGLL